MRLLAATLVFLALAAGTATAADQPLKATIEAMDPQNRPVMDMDDRGDGRYPGQHLGLGP